MMRGYYGVGNGFSTGYGMSAVGVIGCILMMLFVVALITIAIIFIVRLVRHGSNPHFMHGGFAPHHPVAPAIEILNQRLAKGEITVEEYKQIKEEILGTKG